MTRSTRARKVKCSKKITSTTYTEVFNPDHLALPMEEIRRLTLQITNEGDAEKFIRRMVLLMDEIKKRRTDKVAKVARQSKDPAFVRLMRTISRATKEGRLMAARNTAFYAASYAYQNSIEYVRVFMNYLDSFNRS